RGGQADRLVGRDHADHAGAEAHAGERDEERVLATHPVAEPAEQKGAQRADQEPGREQRDRAEQRGHWMALLEKLDRQHSGQAAEDIEVVPLDDVSDRRRNNHTSKILGHCNCHWFLPPDRPRWPRTPFPASRLYLALFHYTSSANWTMM